MSLAQVLYPPPTERGLDEWFQAHARHHEAIIDAVRQTQGIALDNLGLYPVDLNELTTWLTRHQRMHTAMTLQYNVQPTDLSILDLKDRSQADAWFFQHFLQHQSVSSLTGVPI